jgi:hypothetical protein
VHVEFLLVFLVVPVGLVLPLRRHRRNVNALALRNEEQRRRAPSPSDAALRATGSDSWMRPRRLLAAPSWQGERYRRGVVSR